MVIFILSHHHSRAGFLSIRRPLDYEVTRQHEFTVSAHGIDRTAYCRVLITVLDVNDHVPQLLINESMPVYVERGVVAGARVTQLVYFIYLYAIFSHSIHPPIHRLQLIVIRLVMERFPTTFYRVRNLLSFVHT